jgi:hypothetical protein
MFPSAYVMLYCPSAVRAPVVRLSLVELWLPLNPNTARYLDWLTGLFCSAYLYSPWLVVSSP